MSREPTAWPGWTTLAAADGALTRSQQHCTYSMFTLRELPLPMQMRALAPGKRMTPVPASEIVLFRRGDPGRSWYQGWCIRCGSPATRCVYYDHTGIAYGVEEVVVELVCEDCGTCTHVEFDKDTS